MKIVKRLMLIMVLSVLVLTSCRYSTNNLEKSASAAENYSYRCNPSSPSEPGSAEDNDIGLPSPTLSNEFSQACSAYREFLLGQRSTSTGEFLYHEYYTRMVENYESTLVINAEFTLVDINGDGIPELHFRANHYVIYTYKDGEVHWVFACSQNARLLNNLAVYSDFWDRSTDESRMRDYFEFGEDLNPRFSIFFDYGSGIYRIGYNLYAYSNNSQNELTYLSKEEFEAITSPILAYCTDPNNYDMIQWTDFGEWLFEHVDEYMNYEG